MDIEPEVKPEKIEVEQPQKVETKVESKPAGIFGNDFIQRLQANLMAAKGS